MTRSFLSLIIALATTAAVIGASSSASAQPTVSTSAGAAAPAAGPKQDDPEIKEVLNLLNQRRVEDALKKLHEVSLKYPKLPSEYVLMYSLLGQLNQVNAARAILYRAVYETPSDPQPWVIMGDMAMNEGRLPEAELDYGKAGELLPKYPNADLKPMIQQQTLSGLASVAERRQLWKLAQARLEELLKLSPKDIAASQRLARAEFWQGHVDEAFAELKKAKQIDLDNVKSDPTHKAREQMLPAAAMLAQYYDAYERKGKFTGPSKHARDFFDYALKQAPNDLNLREVVAIWALENGEIDLAKEQAKEALRIEAEDAKLPPSQQRYSGSITGRMLSGYVAIWDKKFLEAEDYFERVLLEQPSRFDVKNNLALALIEQDDSQKKDRALQYAYTNYSANKDNIEAASTLSWIYFKLGKYDLADTVMQAVLRASGMNISNPDTFTYLAHILYHGDNGKNGGKFQAKLILSGVLESGRPFSMKPEALKLYELVKDEKPPESAASATPKL